jgi:hypothetical protein
MRVPSKNKDFDMHCIFFLASLITRTRLFFVLCRGSFQLDKESNSDTRDLLSITL